MNSLTHLAILLLVTSLAPLPISAADRPHILFIFSDDQRFDTLGVVNPLIRTPHLDALATSGVRFERAYAATAICSPARAAVLSGRYGTRNGVATLTGALNFPNQTFAQHLRTAGYRTAHFGKWHLATTPAAAGFDHYARINSNGSWFNRNVDTNLPGVAATLGGTFYEEFMADAVIDYLDQHLAAEPDTPLILWWCNQVPHLDGALKYPDVNGTHGSYDVSRMAVPTNWADDPAAWGSAGTKPAYLATSRFVTKSTTEHYGGLGGYTNPAAGLRNATRGEDNVQQHLLEYYASITALDDQIGRVLARLDDPNGDGDPADSIADNTWIIFMGDNGWQTGHHKFTSKVLAYEESARVPLIVKAPGIAPRVESNLVLNLDLTPMLLDLAGLPPASHHQGENLRRLVENPATSWRSHLYYEAVVPEASLGAKPHDAIRDDRYKLIRTYDDSSSSNVVYEELYDLQTDPGEMKNQAANAAFSVIKSSLTVALSTRKSAVANSEDPPALLPSTGNLLTNPSFDSGSKTGWNANAADTSTVVATPLDGGTYSLQFNTGSASSWVEQVGFDIQDFTASWRFQYDGVINSRVMNVHLRSGNNDRLNLRINASGLLQFYNGSIWTTPTGTAGTNAFESGTIYEFTVTGTAWGAPSSSAPDAGTYRISWVDLGDGSSSGSYSSAGQSNAGYRYAMPNTNDAWELDGIRFLDDFGDENDPNWRVDAVSLIDHNPPPPPVPDKVVRISGVYPHLAMTNSHSEVGPGAIAPFADRLWVVTYGPHLPNGDSSNKLYEIDRNLSMTARPDSVGGTPANRMIHSESNQLFIGHHAIAADGTVRTIPVATMPGRMTGIARHLTDPANKLYQATMEEGLYEVDVHTLSVTPLYGDTNGSTATFGAPNAGLPGVHGKGLYSAQGRLVYSNNGNGGSLSQWNRSTWSTVIAEKFTEVTGPGGISGNPPGDDRLWAVGWDERSLLLYLLEDGAWHSFRLPKSSYTHDADPGWYTEWPRIRQLDPADPSSPYLMHMHGMFFDFPQSFSTANFSGLTPISSYHKMPVDYCSFDGQLVMTKNDTSKFSNTLAPRAQSNLWWGEFADLSQWGAPQGHGGVWLNQSVAANEISEPFLVNGFSRITLHLRNDAPGGAPVPISIESSSGDGNWIPLQAIAVPAATATFTLLNDLSVQWLRLRTGAAVSKLTAYLLLSNPYPHPTPPSLVSDEFAALADIHDTTGYSDGVIRVMPGADLKLEFASDSGYHQIAGDLALCDVENAALESDLRADAALTREFGSDAASAWIDADGTRYRLPKLDPLYDAPFLSGWPRGFRETVTEREMLNCHGTFYEIPRSNSGGLRRMRPLATHGKRITDFATWRGLLVLTGVLDDAPQGDSLVRTPDGQAALWLGEIDDIWRMGEPRGVGGPWNDTAVTEGSPSDPFLMYGYHRKELILRHTHDNEVTFTVEIDHLGDNSWSTYQSFPVASGVTETHLFPTGFHAHWVRLTVDTPTTATAQFTYGPADCRDSFLDWARDQGLPTGAGRHTTAALNHDHDSLNALAEWFYGGDPHQFDPPPFTFTGPPLALQTTTRDLALKDPLTFLPEGSENLLDWSPRPDLEQSGVAQDGVPGGFTRRGFRLDALSPRYFLRFRLEVPRSPAGT